jgi:5'-nucleotidase
MPGLLLSGVNRGANLGEDVTYSGTVAAAMEGTLVDIPSISMSQVGRRLEQIKWAPTERHAPHLVRKLFDAGWAKDVLININFPDVAAEAVRGVEVCRQGKRNLGEMFVDERIDARGRKYYWIGFRDVVSKPPPSTDLAVVERGAIAVTPLHLDLTHQATCRKLAKVLA